MKEKTKMRKPPEPPEALHAIRDAAVDHALTGSALPGRIQELYQWIEENFLSFGFEVSFDWCCDFLHIGEFSEDLFSDETLLHFAGLDDNLPLSDAERVAWARKEIDQRINTPGHGHPMPMIECCPIRTPAGAEAVVGCEVLDQLGMAMNCFGVFRTPEECFDFFGGDGYVAVDDLGGISDDRILSYWSKSDRPR